MKEKSWKESFAASQHFILSKSIPFRAGSGIETYLTSDDSANDVAVNL